MTARNRSKVASKVEVLASALAGGMMGGAMGAKCEVECSGARANTWMTRRMIGLTTKAIGEVLWTICEGMMAIDKTMGKAMTGWTCEVLKVIVVKADKV